MMATEHLDSWVGKEKERERGGGILLAHARTGPLGEAKEREKEPLSLSLQPAVASGQVVGPHEAAAATGAPVSPKAGPSSEGAVRSAAGEATLDGEEEEEDTDFRTLEMTHRGDLSPRVILSGHPLAAHLFGGEPLNPGKPAELAAVDEGEDEGDEGGSVQGGGGTQQSSTRAGAGGSRPKPKEIMKRFLSNFTASREGRMSRMTSQASMPGTPKSPTPSASASTQRLQIMGGGTAPAGEGQSPGGRNNNGVDPSKRPRCLIGGRQAGGGGGGSPTGGGGASATGPMRVLGGPSTSSRSAMASNAKEEAVQAVAMLQAQKEELDRLQDASSQLEEVAFPPKRLAG
uniref:Uncharacterized protein n=1 Tax=Chromera velia CCMP2878 TaxID=1169474 RepID=A0A0G4HAS6_9ALVE|eukprot:Cvel_25773.t1-p1 / transcript=Cvel_25773.t1 / gene=Cvel_25773 / organism=Chromera_velia_CCMP2878 / gene_product=hypothetical protein / transcript_product=hypothetical protein / location=Cvel_scaffold2969:7036-11084(-) / protein_length=344 / sequence_SO=supercontig / SO=protein_coding / is_pseudo=false